MNTMHMPGFNAESSLGPTMGKYRAAAGYGRYVSDIGHSSIFAQAQKGLAAIRNGDVHAPTGGGGVVSPWYGCDFDRNWCGCDNLTDCFKLAGAVKCANWRCWVNFVGEISCVCTLT